MYHNFTGSKLAIALVAVAGITPQIATAQSPATSENHVRFRVEGFVGTTTDTRPIGKSKSRSSSGLLPSVSFSSGENFKGQFDLMVADHTSGNTTAYAGHFGFKSTEHSTFGVYAAKVNYRSPTKISSEKYGAEYVYQGPKTTFNLIVGNEKIGNTTHVVGTFPSNAALNTTNGGNLKISSFAAAATTLPDYALVDTYGGRDGLFSIANFTYSPKPDWAITLGHRYTGGRQAGMIGVERAYKWQTSTVSIFAEGRFGDKRYSGAWIGFKVRFGGNGASLKAASDQDVYTNYLRDDLYGLDNTRVRKEVTLPPSPPEPDDNDCVCGACYGA